MLAWPALALLKKQYPDSLVAVLIPAYTEPLAKLCPSIDRIILDPKTSSVTGAVALAKILRQHRFGTVISLFTETRTALACFLARIPVRISPATKIAQFFSNKRLTQRRSQSSKPEYEYNNDLVRFFIQTQGDKPDNSISAPYLQFPETEIATLRQNYIRQHNIPEECQLVFIHPGTGGSAVNLSLEQFAAIGREITQSANIHLIITSGPDELAQAEKLSGLLKNIRHTVYHSTEGLVSFSQFLACSDLFISGSTGPLHIAGALNVKTVAFYSARQSATALRWDTLNDTDKKLAFSPEHFDKSATFLDIDISECSKKISSFLRHRAG